MTTSTIIPLDYLSEQSGRPDLLVEDLYRFQSACIAVLVADNADWHWRNAGPFALRLYVYRGPSAESVVEQVLQGGAW